MTLAKGAERRKEEERGCAQGRGEKGGVMEWWNVGMVYHDHENLIISV